MHASEQILTKQLLSFAAVLLLAICSTASAQEPVPQSPPPSQDKTSQPQTKSDSADQAPSADSTSLDHPVLVTTSTPQIRTIDGAGFVGPYASPLRLGPLYLRYAQYAQVFSSANALDGSGSGDFERTAAQFSAGIVLDKEFRRAQIVLQYVPRLTVFNGQVYPDFVNQDTAANLVFVLTPRLSLNLGNHFVYYRSNNSFLEMYLFADPLSGSTAQKDFIQGPASWLSNSSTAQISYSLSARTRITVTPNYLYANSSGQATSTTFPSVHEYGVDVNYSHDLTARSSITAVYIEQTDMFEASNFKTVYQTVQGGYSHSFNGGWGASGNIGFVTANFESGRTWSASGSASVVKNFRHSRAALAYYRGHAFSGYISKQISDRTDLNYQQDIGRRLVLGGSIGYLRDVQTVSGIWGKYAEGNINFGLTPTLSLFTNYVHKWQRGDGQQVFTGDTDFVRFGIQWTPRQATR
jgi:hypothetical protein